MVSFLAFLFPASGTENRPECIISALAPGNVLSSSDSHHILKQLAQSTASSEEHWPCNQTCRVGILILLVGSGVALGKYYFLNLRILIVK